MSAKNFLTQGANLATKLPKTVRNLGASSSKALGALGRDLEIALAEIGSHFEPALASASASGVGAEARGARYLHMASTGGGGSGFVGRSNGPIFKTTKEATTKAKELGFEKINERVNGQPVYRRGKEYITRDIDSHNGGAWKKANSVQDLTKKETRLGTYDANLNRIGD